MLRVGLKQYQSRIEGLIEENRLPEAATHCHFLLQQYPRHIGTYRLFGRALLEQQLYNDAVDVFKRVFSADPEDLFAHAGLALAYREKQDLAAAIWHMERAFEIEPYNAVIQDELRDLSARSGGVVRRGFGLNRAALARLYFQGGLYPKAVTELLALLEEHSDRFDLQVLLAETYYWDDRRVDAVNQCLLIIEELPYCIKANAILADLWLRSGRFSDARQHLSNLQSLTMLTATDVDPNTTMGKALGNHPDISLPDRIVVDALDEVGPTSTRLPIEAEWLHEIGIANENEVPGFDELEELDTAISSTGSEEAIQIEEEDDLDWLQDVTFTDAEPAAELDEQEAVSEADIDEPLAEIVIESDDVFMEVDETGESEKPLVQPPEITDDQPDAMGEFGDDLPSWSDLVVEEEQRESEPTIGFEETEWLDQISRDTEVDDELPDWLYEAVGFTDELKMPEDYDLPAWLTESVDEPADKTDEPGVPDDSITSPKTRLVPGDEGSLNVGNLAEQYEDNGLDLTTMNHDTSEKSASPLPGWLDDEDKHADSALDSSLDQVEIVDFANVDEPIPWLDDLTAELDEDQTDQTTSPKPNDSSTNSQFDVDETP